MWRTRGGWGARPRSGRLWNFCFAEWVTQLRVRTVSEEAVGEEKRELNEAGGKRSFAQKRYLMKETKIFFSVVYEEECMYSANHFLTKSLVRRL